MILYKEKINLTLSVKMYRKYQCYKKESWQNQIQKKKKK